MAGKTGVAVPRVFPALSTRRILVTALAEGDNFQDFAARAAQDQKDRVGELLWDFAFESIFCHHLFNGDPHPGNYLFAGGGVTFVDFGCVKRFDARHIERWRAFARANLERDIPRANRLWIEMGMVPDLLAKLGATAHWRRKILDILYRPGERQPEPFSEQEVAALHAPV